ncbi:MAG: alpha-amylase C-terminal beta-sheet domain-containing protein [Bacteriovoracaceae bacterium]
MHIRALITFFFLFISFNLSAFTLSNDEILLQGFNWESYSEDHYKDLMQTANEVSRSGFTGVWLPPASKAYDGEGMYPHSRGYIPIGYMDLNSSYGSRQDLQNLVSIYKSLNVKTIADLVLNHRGVSYYENGHYGDNRFARFTDFDWGLWAFTSGVGQDGHGNRDSGEDYRYAFDIDIMNAVVRADFKKYLKLLKEEVGFDGWRYDYVKGYTGEFVGFLNKASSPTISIGEYWTSMGYCGGTTLCPDQDFHRKAIVNWIDSTWKSHGLTPEEASMAFDFTTKGILQESVRTSEYWRLKDSNGKATGVLGWWPSKAVTFIDNHDTGSTQGHWPFGSREQVMMGYAYILTHPGTPVVFYDHFFFWRLKSPITALVQYRKRKNIKNDSKLVIKEARVGLYVAEIDDHTLLKLGPSNWSPGPEWKFVLSGQDYAIWEKDPSFHPENR